MLEAKKGMAKTTSLDSTFPLDKLFSIFAIGNQIIEDNFAL
jgi:hypothetical protein